MRPPHRRPPATGPGSTARTSRPAPLGACVGACGGVALALLTSASPALAQRVFLNPSNQIHNSVSGGGHEAQYALDNANRARDLLAPHGFELIVDQDFNGAPAHANNWGADIFVSVHSNAGGGHGAETLYKTNGGRTLAAAVQAGMLSVYSFGDRGLKQRDNLHVLNNTAMFACLPEVLFHDCTRDHGGVTESAFLRSAGGRAQIAAGLAAGVCGYYDRVCDDGPPPPAYAATFVAKEHPARMTSGEEAVVWVEYRNDGTATWDLARTRLGTTEPRDRASPFFKADNWDAPDRPTEPDHSNYSSGVVGRFTFALVAPAVDRPTVFREHWGLVQEGVAWFGPPDDAVFFDIEVSPAEPVPVDSDGDGHASRATGGDDCDDGDRDVHPGAAERCGDGRDSNCDGADPPCPPVEDLGRPPDPDLGSADDPDLGGPPAPDVGEPFEHDGGGPDQQDTGSGPWEPDTGAPAEPGPHTTSMYGDDGVGCGCHQAPNPAGAQQPGAQHWTSSVEGGAARVGLGTWVWELIARRR